MFYKVAQSGGSFVVAILFDPETKETKDVVARDYDYADCSRDNDEVYYMPINEEAKKALTITKCHKKLLNKFIELQDSEEPKKKIK